MSRSRFFLLTVVPLLCLASACSDARAGDDQRELHARPDPARRSAPALADAPLEAYRAQLLELAASAASAIPREPHLKTRSNAQGQVVEACLELAQPRRALDVLERIDNWRRGLAYAQLACHCIEHGRSADVEPYLAAAQRIADGGEELLLQAWRRDRILAQIAAARVLLDQPVEAARLEQGLVDSETGKVDAWRAERLDDSGFEEQLAALDRTFDTGSLDLVRNGLDVSARLFERFFDDGLRRARVEERILSSLGKIPPRIGIDVLLELARAALRHDAPREALELLRTAEARVADANWLPEDAVELQGALATVRGRAGERDAAKEQLDRALGLYDREREAIVDIWRAGALRSLAEGYASLGFDEAAQAVYGRALEEGVVNPNSRPRAEDLVATCLSLALNGVEPRSELWARMQRVRGALAAPW